MQELWNTGWQLFPGMRYDPSHTRPDKQQEQKELTICKSLSASVCSVILQATVHPVHMYTEYVRATEMGYRPSYAQRRRCDVCGWVLVGLAHLR